MRKKWFRYFCGITAAALLLAPLQVRASDGTSYVYDGYTYDFYGNAKESPAMFLLERTISTENMNGVALSGMNDVCASKDGRIFTIDTMEGRMNVFGGDGELLLSTKLVRTADGKIALDEDGNQIMLNAPEGVFIHEKEQEIYIADTGNKRIVVLDLENYGLLRIIGEPAELSGVTQFNPSKITVDLANRIYVVVQSSYEGILELTRDGEFSGYYGVNTPMVSLADYFWKSIASDEQKKQMAKVYAPAFNNIALDGEGFVMAVTYDLSASDMVFRLNSKGENVLREEGNTFVVGDIWSMNSSDTGSQFVDIAVTDFGTYALLDRSKGRIFLYNFDGELLNAFGSMGNLKGEFKNPTSIAWLGDKLVVTDNTLKCAYILTPTAFGKAVLEGGEIRTLRQINALNIRIAREIKGCAYKILPFLMEGGTFCHSLIVSPPGCGKTTLLRDIIRCLSSGEGGRQLTVGVVDEPKMLDGGDMKPGLLLSGGFALIMLICLFTKTPKHKGTNPPET